MEPQPSRWISRRFITRGSLLVILSVILFVLVARPNWASEIVWDEPCLAFWLNLAGSVSIGEASCYEFAVCYSEEGDSLSLITNRCHDSAHCPYADVLDQANGVATSFKSTCVASG